MQFLQTTARNVLLALRTSTVWVALCTLPCKSLFGSPVLLVLAALCGVVHVVHAPMLLAECAVLCRYTELLWDLVTERDHLSFDEPPHLILV